MAKKREEYTFGDLEGYAMRSGRYSANDLRTAQSRARTQYGDNWAKQYSRQLRKSLGLPASKMRSGAERRARRRSTGGTTNATVGFVLEYGTSSKPAHPWFYGTLDQNAERIRSAMAEKLRRCMEI